MIEFRQKGFSKLGTAIKKAADEPIKTGLAASGTVLGVANLSLNMSRKKKDTELREKQLKAMEELTEALKESNEERIRKAARKAEIAFRKKHPEDITDEDVIILPNPVSSIKKFKK